MRILIATDAWKPQVNGVVRSLESVAKALREFGAEIEFLTPQGFASVPLPTYGEIKLAFASAGSIRKRLDGAPIDHIHIATEGPVGFAARRYCLRNKRAFTTSYHTRFPEYIRARTWLPESITYSVLRRFHNAGSGVMVSTASIANDLEKRGFERLMFWSRGVDHRLFSPDRRIKLDLPGPIYLYAGRLAPEKNIEGFLSLDLPGSKVVVGDGPSRRALEAAYPDAHFVGAKDSDTLAAYYASSDVFVFPSRTDTFGMVLLEALSCGLPVAALPVAGPLDVIGSSGAGVLDEDLRAACLKALETPREKARAYALTFTWANSARQFLDNIIRAKALGQVKMVPTPLF
ncbi:glycosyl transferase group 1 [Methylocella silvestris BL2]|uniref:Glycosyl transferase group 1 n=1 Tax=Methylocella silvestris (strain DSM 15510 / CIP 108128 / LMG 27833 / NCIMB 13906 / BL2) TaxID=395965 RepID=B8EJX4_METSB|nr:glycosyltransferase family 1 protein [Methylocella silvestris]ACK49921.1 glycosyl transferase group 1 [Methylocella silvestris BL2]